MKIDPESRKSPMFLSVSVGSVLPARRGDGWPSFHAGAESTADWLLRSQGLTEETLRLLRAVQFAGLMPGRHCRSPR